MIDSPSTCCGRLIPGKAAEGGRRAVRNCGDEPWRQLDDRDNRMVDGTILRSYPLYSCITEKQRYNPELPKTIDANWHFWEITFPCVKGFSTSWQPETLPSGHGGRGSHSVVLAAY